MTVEEFAEMVKSEERERDATKERVNVRSLVTVVLGDLLLEETVAVAVHG